MIKTLTIDNFRGSMTQYNIGDINSGLSFVDPTFGNDPFINPTNLTWSESATQIDPAGSVITDMILDGKERVENGILYVYAIGHTGRLYKIQVNEPTTYNPDYDNPVLLATLSVDSPTFTRGGFIDFFGSTERIYIGHDKGLNRIDFDGANESAVGTSASWTQNVPRPLRQFLGKLYIGNGTNIGEVDSTASVTTYAKLTPAFPVNTQVRDIDISSDGNYIEIVSSNLALPDITSATQNTTYTSSVGSYIFKWNGTDAGYTAYDTYPTFSLSANIMFQNNKYTFGSDLRGGAVFNPVDKIISTAFQESPLPPAISSNGNILAWVSNFYNNETGYLEMIYQIWGQQDFEIGTGYWCPFGLTATAPETDIIRIPCQIVVSNYGQGASSNGYTDNIFGLSKMYFSTLETSSGPTTAYRFYKWYPYTTNLHPPIVGAYYQTQTQLFSKKATIKELRIYSEPWVAGNSFSIDLIGSGGNGITNGSKTFTAQNSDATAPMYVGTDYAWWNPDVAPTYALALGITNLGESNFVINKIEIDYTLGGK
jgi:hypothetical protein